MFLKIRENFILHQNILFSVLNCYWYTSFVSQKFKCTAAWDASEQFSRIDQYKYTRIKFNKIFKFADDSSEACFKLQRDEFETNNRHRDVHHGIKDDLRIEGYVEAAIASTEEEPHWLMNRCIYVLLVLVLLQLPYNCWLNKKCPKVEYTFVKVFQCDQYQSLQ